MKENKETINEQAVNETAEKTPAGDMPEIRTESEAAKPDNAGKWGGTAVTKKFLTIVMAAAILINAGITAGVMALTARHNGHDGPDMHGGRPGSEMFRDNMSGDKGQMTPPQNGQMAPPQDGQNSSGQNTSQEDKEDDIDDRFDDDNEKDS